MSFRSRRHLVETTVDAIERAAQADRERQDALERAARADDIRGGILALHQPHAQMTGEVGEPLLYCTSCASAWPCETVEFVFRFGKYAPEVIELTE
jgi:hypothetical protein